MWAGAVHVVESEGQHLAGSPWRFVLHWSLVESGVSKMGWCLSITNCQGASLVFPLFSSAYHDSVFGYVASSGPIENDVILAASGCYQVPVGFVVVGVHMVGAADSIHLLVCGSGAAPVPLSLSCAFLRVAGRSSARALGGWVGFFFFTFRWIFVHEAPKAGS